MRGEGGDGLRAYVVWEPILGSNDADVPQATRTVPDARASHYWDGDETLATDLTRILGLHEPAWDVYLIYPPGAKWDGSAPPKPDFWMHQLGSHLQPRANAPWLDGGVFRKHVADELGPAAAPQP